MTSTHQTQDLSHVRRKTFTKFAAALAVLTMCVAMPSTASARGSVHVDLPHFSIGFHDNGYRSYRKHRKHYRKHRRNHYNDYRRNHHNKRYYNKRYYDDGNYTSYRSDRSYRNKQRSRRYSDNYCPTYNYSDRYYQNDGCTAHGNHYHCDG